MFPTWDYQDTDEPEEENENKDPRISFDEMVMRWKLLYRKHLICCDTNNVRVAVVFNWSHSKV